MRRPTAFSNLCLRRIIALIQKLNNSGFVILWLTTFLESSSLESQQSFNTWFADLGRCSSDTRVVNIKPTQFGDLGEEFTEAWNDRCASTCSFVFVRPQPHEFFAIKYAAHVLVFPIAAYAATLHVQKEEVEPGSQSFHICAESFRWKDSRHEHGSLVITDKNSTDDESCLMQQLVFSDIPANAEIGHMNDFVPVPFRHGTVCFDLTDVQSSDLLHYKVDWTGYGYTFSPLRCRAVLLPRTTDTGSYEEQDVQAIIEEMMPEHESGKQVLKIMAFELKNCHVQCHVCPGS